MARYRGPKTKIARKFGEPIFGFDKYFERRSYAPGQHGNSRRRRQPSEYAVQLKEKQKAKYTYGLLERQFANLFDKANRSKGVTGDVLLQLLESRLDNTVFRMGLASTRRQARQMVSHKHVTVNGDIVNVPSYTLRPGDKVSVRERSRSLEIVQDSVATKGVTFPWIEFNSELLEGVFVQQPNVEDIPEKINAQLIVELYSK